MAALPGRATIGISGYAGAGKSTLTRALVGRIPGATRLRGDDFLDPARSHRRSPDWDGVGRDRLREEVLRPHLRGDRTIRYRPFDWSRREPGEPVTLPTGDVLVLDAIGIFHPDLLDLFSLTIWVEADPEDAVRRGMARDRALGRLHDRLWTEVWAPNDVEFAARFAPAGRAELRYRADLER
ncbi:phosphoglycerate transporter [Occultella glacieicola]|uniref:Phosphoglycerate transporter n=1 Tax=Occultella glacieicola TaxID=2518684 RepID=A0ABY2EBP8_9MICO|nr:phosphoglycerate transporter [Occultella glacieicola]